MREAPENQNHERALIVRGDRHIIVRPTQQFWQSPVRSVATADQGSIQRIRTTITFVAIAIAGVSSGIGGSYINSALNANGTHFTGFPNPRPGMREE